MKKKDIFLGVALILMSIAMLLDLRKTKSPALITDQVGAAAFPTLLIAVLILLAVLLIVNALLEGKRKRLQGEKESAAFDWGKFRHTYKVPLTMFAFLSVYIFLTPVVGFYTMTLFFFVSTGILLGGPGKKNLIAVASAAAVSIVCVYYIFQVYMQVLMPGGFLF